MEKRRVVITGIGAICPYGADIKNIWHKLLHGTPEFTPITRFDVSELNTRIAAQIATYDLQNFFQNRDTLKQIRRGSNRMADFACVAALKACENADVLNGEQKISSSLRDRMMLIAATGGGASGIVAEGGALLNELRGKYPSDPNLVASEYGRKRAFAAIQGLTDSCGARISTALGITGGFVTPVEACASGAGAIRLGWNEIMLGNTEICIAGGADAIDEVMFWDFNVLARKGAMTRCNNELTTASKPFDLLRDGFVMSEGGAFLVLEELEHAVRRGVRIYAEVISHGITSDAGHETDPDPNMQARAILKALPLRFQDDLQWFASHLYINAHGTSTPNGDAAETQAIKKSFGDLAYRIPISSTKGFSGHMMGAAGAIEAIVCILSLVERTIPPTMNLCTPDPVCDLNYVVGRAREAPDLLFAENYSFGFGGQNLVNTFERYYDI